MKLQLLAIGRLKTGPERDLVDRYRARIGGLARAEGFASLDAVEFPEGRGRSVAERQASEASRLLDHAQGAALVVFDERGTLLSSVEFANKLRAWRDSGRAAAAFVIGGPDGLSEDIRVRADLLVSFGRLTLPHQLVRALVAEQIYRALTILSGHPYHRGEPR